MAIGYSPRRPDAVIGTGPRLLRFLKSCVAGFMDHTCTRWLRRAKLCRLWIALRQLTCFRGPKSRHTGKRTLPLGARVADNHTFRCRAVRGVMQCLAYSLSLHSPCGFQRLGPTNSGPVHVAQKPFSSSAPRVLTWINATSIGICNARVSTRPHGHASRTRAHPPTPCSLFV